VGASRAVARVVGGVVVAAVVVVAVVAPVGAATASTSADLSVAKADSPDPVAPGGTITYTITVKNNGPDQASSLEVDDVLPQATTFQSQGVPAGWSCTTTAVGNSGKVVCHKGSLDAGDSDSLTLVVKVSQDVKPGTGITNKVMVDAATADPAKGNNTATATTTVGSAQADLSISKSAAPTPAIAGTQLQYALVVHNAGPASAKNVTATDVVPAGTAFQSVSKPSDWSCTTPSVGGTGTITCTTAQMLKGDTDTITVVVLVGAAVPGGATLSNTATVHSDTGDAETKNNTSTALVTVHRRADLAVTKDGPPHAVRPGHLVAYTIEVSNDGPSVAKKVKVTDFLAGHKLFRRVSAPAGWTCTHPPRGHMGWVRCTTPSLGPGDDDVIVLVVRVRKSTDPGTIVHNTGHVASPTPDPVLGNNHDGAATEVRHP